MKKIKQIAALLLSASLILSFAACSNSSGNNAGTKTTVPASDTPYPTKSQFISESQSALNELSSSLRLVETDEVSSGYDGAVAEADIYMGSVFIGSLVLCSNGNSSSTADDEIINHAHIQIRIEGNEYTNLFDEYTKGWNKTDEARQNILAIASLVGALPIVNRSGPAYSAYEIADSFTFIKSYPGGESYYHTICNGIELTASRTLGYDEISIYICIGGKCWEEELS